jgi:flagellar basal body rod protein FlgC
MDGGAPDMQILATALDGMRTATGKAAAAGERIAAGEVEARHVVDLKQAETAHRANARVAQVAGRMQQRLLDILT